MSGEEERWGVQVRGRVQGLGHPHQDDRQQGGERLLSPGGPVQRNSPRRGGALCQVSD